MLRRLLIGVLLLSTVVMADINSGKRTVMDYFKHQGASYTSVRSSRSWKGYYIYEGVGTVRGTRIRFVAVVDPKSNALLDVQTERE